MRSRSGSSRWEAGRIVSCCSFGGFQTIEFGLYVPALAREFLQAPQEGLFGLFRCCHLPTCENHNIGEAEPQHTAIGLAGFSAEYASLPPLRFEVGVSSRDRIFLFNGSKRLKVQAKTCISEWRGVRIVPTFPRVAETTVLMVRISFAQPANLLILLDKDRFWSKGHLCPRCPWLASIGHPEAGLRDAFGAASRRYTTPKSLSVCSVSS